MVHSTQKVAHSLFKQKADMIPGLNLCMVPSQPIIETSRRALISAILEDESTDLLCIGFNETLVEALVTVIGERDAPPNVHLLTTESVLRWVRDDFGLASEAADLVQRGIFSVQADEGVFENQLVITDNSVVSLVTDGDYSAGLPTNHEEFVGAINEKWHDRWNQAEEFSLRTPGRSRVEESLDEEFGSEIKADFQAMLNAIEGTRGDEDLDIVDICLLVAAKHEQLLYDISKWGEEIGIASKATFSRAKTDLEESGLVKTEKVPIEVGRPRLRLLLSEDDLQNIDTSELPGVAQRLLLEAA